MQRSIRLGILLVGMGLLWEPVAADPSDRSQEQNEVWAVVEARIAAWKHNDFETYIGLHHDRWHRFSMVSSRLTSKEDVEAFWASMKGNEEVLEIKLVPIAIDVFANGSAAIAHYVAHETFKWVGETRRRPNGRLMEKGRIYNVPARFSDVYVKEENGWLFAGGYRDLTCDILAASPNPCRD